MAELEGIPAVEHALADNGAEEEDLEFGKEKDEHPHAHGKYRFNGQHISVTWSRSTIDSQDEFHKQLTAVLPAGVRIFDDRELHQDSTLQYLVVFSFAHKVHWLYAAKKFSIEGDTNAVRFEKLKPRVPVSGFLNRRSVLCSEDGVAFGEIWWFIGRSGAGREVQE
ncbi:hypothetical protein IMSHALPRED_001942 [Imshaugia aleurites]|uniref:Uncharacterized protein n=1 Tax=Imshaugia aleurites TaxID=172621 RepID=A0A8H3I4D3_9LECA|nr:hypothetical protein IMSHALPRED_001942 [Imshaugia aleurites]